MDALVKVQQKPSGVKDYKDYDYKVGDIVRWCWTEIHRSTFFIIEIDKKGVLLKQNFGMGQILTSKVPISEIEMDY